MGIFLFCNRTQMLLIIKASMSVQKNREQQPPSTLNAAFVNGGCCCSSMSLPGVAAGEERGQQPDNHWTLYPRPTITETQPQYRPLPCVYTWMRKRWIKSPQQTQTCFMWHSHFITQLSGRWQFYIWWWKEFRVHSVCMYISIYIQTWVKTVNLVRMTLLQTSKLNHLVNQRPQHLHEMYLKAQRGSSVGRLICTTLNCEVGPAKQNSLEPTS